MGDVDARRAMRHLGLLRKMRRLAKKHQKRVADARKRRIERNNLPGDERMHPVDRLLGQCACCLPQGITPSEKAIPDRWRAHTAAMEEWNRKIDLALASAERRGPTEELLEQLRAVTPLYTAWWSLTRLVEGLIDVREWSMAVEFAGAMRAFLDDHGIPFRLNDHALAFRAFKALDGNRFDFPKEMAEAELVAGFLVGLGIENSSTLDDLVRYSLEEGRLDDAVRWLSVTGDDHARWSFVTSMVVGRRALIASYSDEQMDSLRGLLLPLGIGSNSPFQPFGDGESCGTGEVIGRCRTLLSYAASRS